MDRLTKNATDVALACLGESCLNLSSLKVFCKTFQAPQPSLRVPPGIGQLVGTFDGLEFAGNPQDFAVWKLIRYAVVPADPEVHFGADAQHLLRSPPLLQLLNQG